MSKNFQTVGKVSKQNINLPDVQNATEDVSVSKAHPLMMSVVLRCVFDNIGNVMDLKSCRLVNSTWNEAAIYRLNKLCSPVTIYYSDKLESLKSCIVASNRDNNRWRFPFTKFRIRLTPSKTVVEEFLPLIAPWVTDIILLSMYIYTERCMFSNTNHLDNLEFPSLKSLNVDICLLLRGDVLRRRQTYLSLVTKIIQNSSHLEHLFLRENYDESSDPEIKEIEPMTNQILDKLETIPNGKLRVLEINATVENSHLRRLTNLKLSLTHLQLDFDYTKEEMINPEILRDFLQTQRETLVKLELKNLGASRIKEVLFPAKMEKLKTIEIGKSSMDHYQKHVTFPDLNINKQMPVLTEIIFRDYGNGGWFEFVSYHLTSQPVTSVKRVRFLRYFPFIANIELGMRVFPNAKRSFC